MDLDTITWRFPDRAFVKPYSLGDVFWINNAAYRATTINRGDSWVVFTRDRELDRQPDKEISTKIIPFRQ